MGPLVKERMRSGSAQHTTVARPGITTLSIRTGGGSYPVWVGPGLLDDLAGLLRLEGRVAVVGDSTVLSLYGERVLRSFPGAVRIEIAPGEENKTIAMAERVWDQLGKHGLGRKDTLIALGGGVVGDLGGFAAATWHRGMDFVQVPTTLLAQVDSSVGGKVAVDHALGKNLIGAFHAPRAVVADTETLQTLPERERWSGLAEVAKAAFLADGLLDLLETDLEAVASGRSPNLPAILAHSISIKAAIVEADERENDLRRVLNFGHTIGHGLEAASGYQLRHGEAVVLGMRAALHLSHKLTGLPATDRDRALALLDRFPLPRIPPLDPAEVLELVKRDKKAAGGKVAFVLLRALGQPVVVPVEEGTLAEGIELALGAGGSRAEPSAADGPAAWQRAAVGESPAATAATSPVATEARTRKGTERTRVLVLHGPNLNLLGEREPGIYGNTTLPELDEKLHQKASELGLELRTFQSNHEGSLIDEIHQARRWMDALVINPGAYTHSSYALRDAIASVGVRAFEVHLSDIHKREPWRRVSLIAEVCEAQISGLGPGSYLKALEEIVSER